MPSLPWMDSWPSHDDVGRFFFDFDRDASRRYLLPLDGERILEMTDDQKNECDLRVLRCCGAFTLLM